MTIALVCFAFLAGAGGGFLGGVLFARSDEGKRFTFLTQTVDRLVASSLYPGLQTIVEKSPPSLEGDGMYETQDVDNERVPKWMEDEAPVWDATEEPVG